MFVFLQSQVGVSICGTDIRWPSRRNFDRAIVQRTATECGECLVTDDSGSGCSGECKYTDTCENAGLSSSSITPAAWVGIAFGILFFLLLLIVVLYLFKTKKGSAGKDVEAEKEPAIAPDLPTDDASRASIAQQMSIEEETRDAPAVSVARISVGVPPPRQKKVVPTIYVEAENLQQVTRKNAVRGLKVVRGRSWQYGNQDGGEGSIGILKMCVKCPNWWMIQWPKTAPHAYYCGEDEHDRCELAVAPGEDDSEAVVTKERSRQSLDRQRAVEDSRSTPVRLKTLLKMPIPENAELLSTPSANVDADDWIAITRANAAPGVNVVRGRSWDYFDQDGGKGSVGEMKSCIKAPNWWMVHWPNAPPHAYYVGETSLDRCDLALAPGDDQNV